MPGDANKRHIDRAVGDASRANLAVLRAETACARLRRYRAFGLQQLRSASSSCSVGGIGENSSTKLPAIGGTGSRPTTSSSKNSRAFVTKEDAETAVSLAKKHTVTRQDQDLLIDENTIESPIELSYCNVTGKAGADDARGLMRMVTMDTTTTAVVTAGEDGGNRDDSVVDSTVVLMVVTPSQCILQSDDEEGESFQAQFEVNGSDFSWMVVGENSLQIDFRSHTTVAHLGQKIHVLFKAEGEDSSIEGKKSGRGMDGTSTVVYDGTTIVVYDDGPVKQVILTDDGHVGVHLRDAVGASDADDPPITKKQAKERRDLVCEMRDNVTNKYLPLAKDAVNAAEAMIRTAESAQDAAVKQEMNFHEARSKLERAKAGEKGALDVVLENSDGSDGCYIAKVNSERVEIVQLPDKIGGAKVDFGGALVQFSETKGEWSFGCKTGNMKRRPDGVSMVKLNADGYKSENTMASDRRVEQMQFVPGGIQVIAFDDESHLKMNTQDGTCVFLKEGKGSAKKQFFFNVATKSGDSNSSCTLIEDRAGKSIISKWELEKDGTALLLHKEEDTELQWVLKGEELAVISGGVRPKITKPKAAAKSPKAEKIGDKAGKKPDPSTATAPKFDPETKDEDKRKKDENREEKKMPEDDKHGHVDDGVTGVAIDGATITAKVGGKSVKSTKSDTDGMFDLGERTLDLVVTAEKAGYAPSMILLSKRTLAFCISLSPLTSQKEFESSKGVVHDEGNSLIWVRPATVVTYHGKDGVPYSGKAELQCVLPSPEENDNDTTSHATSKSSDNALQFYVGIIKAVVDGEGGSKVESDNPAALLSVNPKNPIHITVETTNPCILEDGACFPTAYATDMETGDKVFIPTRRKKSLVFRSLLRLPGAYVDPSVRREIRREVDISVSALLQKEYQQQQPELDRPRLFIAHSAQTLIICGIVEVKDGTQADNSKGGISPLLLQEAKKESSLLRSALIKCKVDQAKVNSGVGIETTYETVIDWVSTNLTVDGIEIPAITDKAIMAKAHSEVNLIRELDVVGSRLCGSQGAALSGELESAAAMKAVPTPLQDLAITCLSLFADTKKTTQQLGGFNAFRKEAKSGLFGRCVRLNPYRIAEKVVVRTQGLIEKLDKSSDYDSSSGSSKLQKDGYFAAHLLASWIREFLKTCNKLKEIGATVTSSDAKKMGSSSERNFLDITSPIPALTMLRSDPLRTERTRIVKFQAPRTGWWNVEFG